MSCVGPQSEEAGKADGCAGCPSQKLCATGKTQKIEDTEDYAIIQTKLSQIQHKIFSMANKGGVGKSTLTTQLALYLAGDNDLEIGVLDLDLTGPSVPRMLGSVDATIADSGTGWNAYTLPSYPNVQTISTGMLLPDEDTPVIWKGGRKHEMITRMLRDVHWNTLDYMIVDMPPGTSDEHLSSLALMNGDGKSTAIIITTPQEMAQQDVRKEIAFCRKMKIRILGVIENMAMFECPNCHHKEQVLPQSSLKSTKQMCADLKVEFLGSLPLDPRVGRLSEKGLCMVDEFPDAPYSESFKQIVDKVLITLS